jgi:hypothetical protein
MILIKQKQLNDLYDRFGLTETPQGNIQDFTEAQHQFMHILYRDYDTKGRSYAQVCGIGHYPAYKRDILDPEFIKDVLDNITEETA